MRLIEESSSANEFLLTGTGLCTLHLP